jgi:hypothetical protein
MGTTYTETYNGWANKVTWQVNLWLTNDYELYRATMNLASGAHGKAWLADKIHDHVWDMCALDEARGLQWELMAAALNTVAWDEIAQGFLDCVYEAHNECARELDAARAEREDNWTDESDVRQGGDK